MRRGRNREADVPEFWQRTTWLALAMAMVCGASCGQVDGSQYVAYEMLAVDPGEIRIGMAADDDTVSVLVQYLSKGVVLCDWSWSCEDSPQFERSYEYHDVDIDRLLSRQLMNTAQDPRLDGTGFMESSRPRGWGPNGDEVGRLGDAVYLSVHPRGDWRKARDALRDLVARGDTLGKGYVARLYGEQFTQGRWRCLTRYADDVQGFCLAPEDTIMFRVQVWALKAIYLRDRAIVAAIPEKEARELLARVTRPALNDMAKDLGPYESVVGVGDGSWATWIVPRPKVFPGSVFNVAIDRRSVSESGETAIQNQAAAQYFVYGPTVLDELSFPNPARASAWPVVPTPANVRTLGTQEEGFPGFGLYPEWAAARLMSWGLDWWRPEVGSPEYKAYGPGPAYLKALERMRQRIEEQDGKAASDSFWTSVMDYAGSASGRHVQ